MDADEEFVNARSLKSEIVCFSDFFCTILKKSHVNALASIILTIIKMNICDHGYWDNAALMVIFKIIVNQLHCSGWWFCAHLPFLP